MKSFLPLVVFLLVFSACSEEETDTITIRINHFMEPVSGLPTQLVLQVQQGESIGTEDWSLFSAEIEGFDFEWGYTCELRVYQRPISNPPQDGSSIAYELREVVAKTPVATDVTFSMRLKSTSRGIVDLEEVLDDTNYLFSDRVTIDCSNLCESLGQAFEDSDEVVGVFSHINGHTIGLQELILE